MKIKLLRTCLVGGYKTPQKKGSIVAPSTENEAKALINAGVAAEYNGKDDALPPDAVSASDTIPLSGVVKKDEADTKPAPVAGKTTGSKATK